MTIPQYDPSLHNRDCTGCEENQCSTDGCDKLIAIGDCSKIINALNPDGTPTINGYIQPENNIIDPDTWCEVEGLTDLTINPNQTFNERFYLNKCVPKQIPGRKRPTIDLTVDFCDRDEGHCLLHRQSMNGCLVAFFCMEKRSEFVPNVSLNTLPDVTIGMARVQAPTRNFVADQLDSRTYTLLVDEYFWELNICGLDGNPLRRVESTSVANNKVSSTAKESEKAAA